MAQIVKIPSAKQMMIGLRSMGYSFSTALADIIDNSIAAHAKNIWVDSEPQGNDSYVFILDDGDGMNKEKLEDAMSFGSCSNHDGTDSYDLGRFGLGLNTASLSQCRKFIVVTKQGPDINAAYWDVDELEANNNWILNTISDEHINDIPGYNKIKDLEHGTLVVWQKFDKIASLTTVDKFESTFRSRVSDAKKHCELVFHRFYEEINIFFNNARINKRDPFLVDFDNAQHKNEEYLNIQNEKIYYQAHVLPHFNSLTNEEKNLIGGLATMKNEQGFYIYRNRRLIMWGSWLHMSARSEFYKLARIRVDVPSTLDSLWSLDVKKTTAAIPDVLKEQLYAVVEDASGTSLRLFKFKGEKEMSEQAKV